MKDVYERCPRQPPVLLPEIELARVLDDPNAERDSRRAGVRGSKEREAELGTVKREREMKKNGGKSNIGWDCYR